MQRTPGSLPTVRSSPAHDIDRAAQQAFLAELPPSWSWQNLAGGQDYGLDYLIEIIESFAPTGTRFAVQLKGIATPREIGSAIHFSFPTKNLGTYVSTEQLPVFLVVANVTTKQAFYLFLQRFADEHLTDEEWAGQGTVTVMVPLANRVSDHEALRRAASEARDYMLGVRASPMMSLARRRAELEKIDKRFSVKASATEKGEHYEITAKEDDVRFGLSFAGLDAERRSLLRRGYSVPVAHGEITFRNLPIVERFAPQMTGIQIAAHVECTATFEAERDGVVAALTNLPTTMTIGIDEIRISSAYTNAPIDIDVTLALLEPKASKQARATIGVNQSVDARWFGQRIDRLAHFDRIHAFAAVTEKPYRWRMLIHVPGEEDFEVPWSGPLGLLTADSNPYDAAMRALQLARETSKILGIYPPLPSTVVNAGFGDVELLHALVTVGEYEGDGSRAFFWGHTPPNGYTEKLDKETKRRVPFEASPDGRDCRWSFLGEKVVVPLGRLTLSRARCTVTSVAKGLVRVEARGTKGSRFWVKRELPAAEPPK